MRAATVVQQLCKSCFIFASHVLFYLWSLLKCNATFNLAQGGFVVHSLRRTPKPWRRSVSITLSLSRRTIRRSQASSWRFLSADIRLYMHYWNPFDKISRPPSPTTTSDVATASSSEEDTHACVRPSMPLRMRVTPTLQGGPNQNTPAVSLRCLGSARNFMRWPFSQRQLNHAHIYLK